MLVTFKYNKNEYKKLIEKEQVVDPNDVKQELIPKVSENTTNVHPPTPVVSTATKFVTLHYNPGYLNSTSPIKSQRRSRNRTPTPPSSLTPNTTFPYQKSSDIINSSPIKMMSKESSQELAASSPSQEHPRSFQDIIDNMGNYNQQYILNPGNNQEVPSIIAHNQQLENLWFNDVRSIADRLHLLRETYRTVQMLKKSKVGRTSNNGRSQDMSGFSKSVTPRMDEDVSVEGEITTDVRSLRSSRQLDERGTSAAEEEEFEELDGFEEDEDSSNTDTLTVSKQANVELL